jgi:hypothetical protein
MLDVQMNLFQSPWDLRPSVYNYPCACKDYTVTRLSVDAMIVSRCNVIKGL